MIVLFYISLKERVKYKLSYSLTSFEILFVGLHVVLLVLKRDR